jgi:hypothetical protein
MVPAISIGIDESAIFDKETEIKGNSRTAFWDKSFEG